MAVAAAVALLAGTVVHVHAAEGNFLEMLFGGHSAPQPVQQAAPARSYERAARPRARLGVARHQLRTRYAALPVKIRIGERPRDGEKGGTGDRQVPLDMRQGAAAALLKDETLRPGDIVVLNTGARVFTGGAVKRRTLSDFEPVATSSYVDKPTRTLLAGMVAPVGALPADAARRMMARLRKAAPQPVAAQTATQVVAQTATMRIINPWRTAP